MRLRLLLGGVLLPLALWAALPIGSHGSSPQGRLGQLQHQIQTVQGKIGRRKGTERVLSTEISAYSGRIAALQRRIGVLARRESAIQADLDARRAELVRLQDALRFQRARLIRLRAKLAHDRAVLSRRLVQLYTSAPPDLVSVVLDAKGFADLLDRGEFLRRIGRQDQRVIETVRSAKADATGAAARLAVLERRSQQVAAAILDRRNAVAAVRSQLIGTRVGLQSTRAGKSRALAKVQASRMQLEGNLSGLRAEQAKITATLQAAQGTLPVGPVRHGSGMLIWPVDGPITSPFCERRAWESCHPGIDIGVPSGTPIRAAAAGRVALLQPVSASGGYGNFTCIQHTAAMATCYAHQSRFAVGMGQQVAQGQVIGYSGCTGLCFGPHLHFEVRIDGHVVNPLSYL
ncbi:MAG TPA: peptidoglycan DD-metalloendopeptidase family protein [Solirubrobacteraceae bacterium]|nr:peptidoglycan DD-metalloendopeptidase family protein [Solirubrobacteraceae bacterium]